ncbi:GntR family transcriptional regulator [Tabrizicola sp. J26]|uniref:GntR family transcriptional regulator n=1 Tax=Alitabrizicola rongguiensis TaxID=2909234 RepID=UPI001F24A6CB|nr:GntR family transcriptional regulator [Tabrizicola rongguiensis]MCF1711123.1 GntR family transcriptional regulator [Tabrizicola rongguiensis]
MNREIARIEKPRPVSELVLERLRQDIIENRFMLGEKISEGNLSELYGVTKAPIRWAYSRLEGEGLIEIRPQSGTFVFRPTVDELRALCELRSALEVAAVELAFERDRAGLAEDIRRTCVEMREALRTRAQDAYQILDSQFHLSIIGRAKSSLLEQTYISQVNGRFAALRYRFSKEEAHNANSMSEHEALRDAIAAGDRDQTVALLRAHIAYTERYYSRIVT